MQTETLSLTIESSGDGEFSVRLGTYTGVGSTREAALTALAQRISGLSNESRDKLWGKANQESSGRSKTAG